MQINLSLIGKLAISASLLAAGCATQVDGSGISPNKKSKYSENQGWTTIEPRESIPYSPELNAFAWEDAKRGPSRNGIVDDGDFKRYSNTFNSNECIVIESKTQKPFKGAINGIHLDRKSPCPNVVGHGQETLKQDGSTMHVGPMRLQPGNYSAYQYTVNSRTCQPDSKGASLEFSVR